MCVYTDLKTMLLLTRLRFIEENNEYKNQQKEIQRKRGSPPGMAPQELMMYWGTRKDIPKCNNVS